MMTSSMWTRQQLHDAAVLLQMVVEAIRIRGIARLAMLMVDVHGAVETVLLSMEISDLANQMLDVHGPLQTALASEHMINHLVNHTVVVLGAIVDEIVRDLMK